MYRCKCINVLSVIARSDFALNSRPPRAGTLAAPVSKVKFRTTGRRKPVVGTCRFARVFFFENRRRPSPTEYRARSRWCTRSPMAREGAYARTHAGGAPRVCLTIAWISRVLLPVLSARARAPVTGTPAPLDRDRTRGRPTVNPTVTRARPLTQTLPPPPPSSGALCRTPQLRQQPRH